jgi:zinc protease
MKSRPAVMAILMLAVAVSVPAQTARKGSRGRTAGPAPAKLEVPKIDFEKYTLPNGLDVILHVDRKLPIVHVNQWFQVGSKNERRGRTGFAHLFEHMMFQGSKNAPGEYFSYVEKAGANLAAGGVNGTTNNDRTNYFVTAPAGKLEYLLWLESDRLATLPEVLDQQKLDNQIEVVRNERREGLENVPYGRWEKLLFENLHPTDHPYSWTVIGSHEDLKAATLEDVKEFFRTYYSPGNLSLVIAGDFDPAEAKVLVEKYFGSIPPGPPLDRPAQYPVKLEGERIVEASDRVPQERVYMVWPGPRYFSADDATLDLVSLILTDGLSSRLQKALVYDRQVASNVASFHWPAEISGVFGVAGTARAGQSLAEIERIVTAEISRLAKDGPTEGELNRARTKYLYGFIDGLERIGGFGGKADLLNQYNIYAGRPGMFDEDIARYQAVTASGVRSVVARWLDTRNRLLIRFHPDTSSKLSSAPLDRSKAPDLGTDRPFTAPEVKSAVLENGLTVLVVERRELPKVSFDLITRAGAVADPPDKLGLANMVMRVIDRGTRTRSAIEIDEALGNLGAQIGGNAARESSIVQMSVLKSHLDEALAIAGDTILNPSFPQEEFDREQKLQLDALSQEANNPNALASRVRAMTVFGRLHPYGRPARGLPVTVSSITREDLARFHSEWWKPGSSAVVFVGDITLEEGVALARKHFGAWSGGAAPSVMIPAPQPMSSSRIYVIDRPEAAQTVVTQSLPIPARKMPDYYALTLADAVWGGGGFGTRLNLNLREDKGYSYGVYSVPVQYLEGGFWFAQGGVQTDKTKESVTEFLNELSSLSGRNPISEAELTNAKLTRVRGYAQQFESYARVADQIAILWALRLPMSELQREPQEIERATLDAVNAAARTYAVPTKAILLLVGDLARIEAGLKELDAGEIVVLDQEGIVVR